MIVHVRNERLAKLANVYENRLYGRDFETRLQDIESWLLSPMYFWSVCSAKPLPTRLEDILGSLSILAVPASDASALLAGRIVESELRPWDWGCGESAAFYFCSYSMSVAGAGRQQMLLAEDYFEKMSCFDQSPPVMALSIAATDAGAAHLKRSGFSAESGLYLGKYDFYRAECGSEPQLSKFWASMLRCQVASCSLISDHPKREFAPA